MKRTLIIIATILLLPSLLLAEERMIIRFNQPDETVLSEFLTGKYDVPAYEPGVFLDIVVTKTQHDELLGRNLDFQVTLTESQLKRNLQLKSDYKVAPGDTPVVLADEALPGYRDYTTLVSELQQIESDYPGICELHKIGESRGKQYSEDGSTNYDDYRHEIWALKVSDNVQEEEDEPSFYFMGAQHAREPVSLEVVMAVLYYILENYGTDPTITGYVNNSQIWFVPLVNPDGHKVVTDQIDLWWRKNIRDNNANGRFDPDYSGGSAPDGVDLNRNHGFHWGYAGASGNAEDQTYHGPHPWSEPENQAIRDFMEAHHFVAGVSYHSYGELVLFPYSYLAGAIAPDHEVLKTLAAAMAESIPAKSATPEHPHYTSRKGSQLSLSAGDSDDFAYGARGIFAFTIELGETDQGFIPPANDVGIIANDNLEAAMLLLGRVNYSTLTGHVTDAETGEPVVAEIFVAGVDDTGAFRYPYLSDADFGRYYRLLEGGTYDVTFSAEGYESVTLKDVDLDGTGQTIQNVALNPAVRPVVPDVEANGSDLPVIVYSGENLSITVALDPLSAAGVEANWWLLADTPVGWYHHKFYPGTWAVGRSPAYRGALFNVEPLEVLNISDLLPGTYTFYFGVDLKRNGGNSPDSLYYDSVVVQVMP